MQRSRPLARCAVYTWTGRTSGPLTVGRWRTQLNRFEPGMHAIRKGLNIGWQAAGVAVWCYLAGRRHRQSQSCFIRNRFKWRPLPFPSFDPQGSAAPATFAVGYLRAIGRCSGFCSHTPDMTVAAGTCLPTTTKLKCQNGRGRNTTCDQTRLMKTESLEGSTDCWCTVRMFHAFHPTLWASTHRWK